MLSMPRFMQTLSKENYDALVAIAKKKAIKLQELIRTVIVPEWLEEERKKE